MITTINFTMKHPLYHTVMVEAELEHLDFMNENSTEKVVQGDVDGVLIRHHLVCYCQAGQITDTSFITDKVLLRQLEVQELLNHSQFDNEEGYEDFDMFKMEE